MTLIPGTRITAPVTGSEIQALPQTSSCAKASPISHPRRQCVRRIFRGVIELLTFRLLEGADETAFLAADRRVQTGFAYLQPGLLRRTTARGADGDWLVMDIWRSEADADACDSAWGRDDVTEAFMSFVDPVTVRTARYETLD